MKAFRYLLPIFFCSFVANAQDEACGNNAQARELVSLIKNDPKQQRAEIRCNKLLTDAAVAKATLMADYGLVIHTLGGSPNKHLRESNYQLPDHYGDEFDSNQVEAIAGGFVDAEEVWEVFKSSDGHRSHLLGEHEFYLEQDEIGVAFLYDWETPHIEYWVVYLTKGYMKNQEYAGDINDIPNKGTFIIRKPKSSASPSSN
jgi:uncharacterized protein YkwD